MPSNNDCTNHDDEAVSAMTGWGTALLWLGWSTGVACVVVEVFAARRVPKADRCGMVGTPAAVLAGGILGCIAAFCLPWVTGISVRTGQPLTLWGWFAFDLLSMTLLVAVLIESGYVVRRGAGIEPKDGLGGGGGRPAQQGLWMGVLCGLLVVVGNVMVRAGTRVPEPVWGAYVGIAAWAVLLVAAIVARVDAGRS